MVQLKRVRSSGAISNFRQEAPQPGAIFGALAQAAETAYQTLAPAAAEQLSKEKAEEFRNLAKQQIGDPSFYPGMKPVYGPAPDTGPQPTPGPNGSVRSTNGGAPEATAASVIRDFEGYRDTPYWDVNAHRIGFGSDTITGPDGTVRRVKPGDKIGRDDAERDLTRRLRTEFMPIAQKAAGAAWTVFHPTQQAALTSIAYNYGEIPKRILGAVRSGDPQKVAAAIRTLAGDNKGINADRRKREAEMFLSGGGGDDALRGGLVIAPGDGGTGVPDRMGAPEASVAALVAGSAPGGANAGTTGGADLAPQIVGYEQPDWAPTILKNGKGELEARLFSPMSLPFMRAANAAAGFAYAAEVQNRAAIDMMGLREKYTLDPKGFQQAGQEYVDSIVKAAPESFRPDIRASLETDMQRTLLGVYDEKQRDTYARANASSSALIERWSGDLTDALAAGDPVSAEQARSKLGNLLRARESMPGVVWTPEQSENVVLKAEDAAQAKVETRQRAQGAEWKKSLALIEKAATAGSEAAEEAILNNPAVAAMLPHEYASAAAAVMLRDKIMPGMSQMTPDQQDEAAAAFRADPVWTDGQLDIASAAESAAKTSRAAWGADPMGQADKVMPTKPPPIPSNEELATLSLGPDGGEAVDQVIKQYQARREYANGLRDAGYFDVPAMLSDSEAEALGAVLSSATDPGLKAALAKVIVSGFGEDAATVFREIKSDDPVTKMAGMLMAGGGEESVAIMAMAGEMARNEGLVQLPPEATRLEAMSSDAYQALTAAGVPLAAQGDIMKMATAIYCAQARGAQLTSTASKDLMRESVGLAMGQSQNRAGQKTGGVQRIGGHPSVVPMGMAGEDLEKALGEGFRIPTVFGYDPAQQEEFWRSAGNGVPDIDVRLWDMARLRVVPAKAGKSYYLERNMGPGDWRPVASTEGGIFEFDPWALVEAAQ